MCGAPVVAVPCSNSQKNGWRHRRRKRDVSLAKESGEKRTHARGAWLGADPVHLERSLGDDLLQLADGLADDARNERTTSVDRASSTHARSHEVKQRRWDGQLRRPSLCEERRGASRATGGVSVPFLPGVHLVASRAGAAIVGSVVCWLAFLEVARDHGDLVVDRHLAGRGGRHRRTRRRGEERGRDV